ncbi:MAG: hypothetical protein PHG53_09490 [Phycisphaerae bacterium]|nr:hypothetical protein [Phycisphaerae bacterium]
MPPIIIGALAGGALFGTTATTAVGAASGTMLTMSAAGMGAGAGAGFLYNEMAKKRKEGSKTTAPEGMKSIESSPIGNAKVTAGKLSAGTTEDERMSRRLSGSLLTKGWASPTLGTPSLLGGGG